MTSDEFTKSMIVLTLWRLAGADGLDCMLAIACMLANRVKLEKKSWMGVLADDLLPSPLPDTRNPVFLKLLQSVDTIYEGKARDASNGATKWADLTAEPAPVGLSLCCRVGRWSFFRPTS